MMSPELPAPRLTPSTFRQGAGLDGEGQWVVYAFSHGDTDTKPTPTLVTITVTGNDTLLFR